MTARQHYVYVAACVAMVVFSGAFWFVAMPAILRSVGA